MSLDACCCTYASKLLYYSSQFECNINHTTDMELGLFFFFYLVLSNLPPCFKLFGVGSDIGDPFSIPSRTTQGPCKRTVPIPPQAVGASVSLLLDPSRANTAKCDHAEYTELLLRTRSHVVRVAVEMVWSVLLVASLLTMCFDDDGSST